jgi:hypothetical protein
VCEHGGVRLLPVLLVVVAVAVGCGGEGGELPPPTPAPPQTAKLGWTERYPAGTSGGIVFTVSTFALTSTGWRAEVGIANETGVPWQLPGEDATVESLFGLILLPTGDLAELERRNRAGDLLPVREARTFRPELPVSLEPGASWRGTMAGPGNLPAGLWVRLVFGPLHAPAAGDLPEGMQSPVVWFTDHAYRLAAQREDAP